jgi:hypothetical protein
MWWLPFAYASAPQPTWLPDTTACSDAGHWGGTPPSATAVAHASAWIAALGAPDHVDRVVFHRRAPNCCPPITVSLIAAAGETLGTMDLSDDCTLLRASLPDGSAPIPSFPLPVGTTSASAIVAAWPSVSARAVPTDVLVGWPERRGFRVALVRVWPTVTVSVAEVWLDAEGAIRRVRREIRPFTVPEGAMAATPAVFGLVDPDAWYPSW